ncbi:MAG: hypothetical protein QOF12_2355, partial [Solirubrobacteraceae bacterium]|nr:hypothetical protein [Solirubrobacteraceae bacterium]
PAAKRMADILRTVGADRAAGRPNP